MNNIENTFCSYFPDTPGSKVFSPTNVSAQLALSSLIDVDDVTYTLTIELYYRLSWIDPRIVVPEMFTYLNPDCTVDGNNIF